MLGNKNEEWKRNIMKIMHQDGCLWFENISPTITCEFYSLGRWSFVCALPILLSFYTLTIFDIACNLDWVLNIESEKKIQDFMVLYVLCIEILIKNSVTKNKFPNIQPTFQNIQSIYPPG